MIAITALLARLYGPLTALSNIRIDVMTALVSFERVFEVLDLAPMVTSKPGATALTTSMPRVEFKDVTFRYPKADEISLGIFRVCCKAGDC